MNPVACQTVDFVFVLFSESHLGHLTIWTEEQDYFPLSVLDAALNSIPDSSQKNCMIWMIRTLETG